MRPQNTSAQEAQGELFRSRLDQILNRKPPLFQLANQINWQFFDTEFGQLFVENVGRPGLPTRLIVGLHYPKHAFNESEESVGGRFLENPYWGSTFVVTNIFCMSFPSIPLPWSYGVNAWVRKESKSCSSEPWKPPNGETF